jgi:hypothetical protein
MVKKESKNCATTIAQNPPAQGRQLELFTFQGKRHKPQISSISGISVKQRDRYRVVLGDEILGDFLSSDEAIALARRGAR